MTPWRIRSPSSRGTAAPKRSSVPRGASARATRTSGPAPRTDAAAAPVPGPRVSVVTTVRNEEKNIAHLLESLLPQKHLHEVIVVDAASTDRTVRIARSFGDRLRIQVVVQPCRRGEGRNIGARLATGDLFVFIDGDCRAAAAWLDNVVQAWAGDPRRVVAGRTILDGFWAFTKLHRVELPHRGQDTTWPSCNLAYPRALFERLSGFDPTFVTAEDIDLNFRAVSAGAHIVHEPRAVVFAKARDSIGGFLRQAYWNGYGRKQLTRKHGRLWVSYRFREVVRHQGGSFWGLLRMAAGALGYLRAKRDRHAHHDPHPDAQRGAGHRPDPGRP